MYRFPRFGCQRVRRTVGVRWSSLESVGVRWSPLEVAGSRWKSRAAGNERSEGRGSARLPGVVGLDAWGARPRLPFFAARPSWENPKRRLDLTDAGANWAAGRRSDRR